MSYLLDDCVMLQNFFERSVKRFPKNIAIICNDKKLTYEELDKQVNKLANYLIKQNINTGSAVGILLERSINCYIAMLAILKIGAFYVPIETEYPDDRVNYIIADMSLQTLLVSASQCSRELLKINQIIIDNIYDKVLLENDSSIELKSQEKLSESLAYVIYTSGSTGNPKGVAIPHKSVCHYIKSSLDVYNINPDDRIYQGFSLSFDASLEEIWMAFANGATLVVCTDKGIRSGLNLVEFLNDNQVSVFSTIPTLLSTLENKLTNLRLLIMGGEVCNTNLLKRWHRPNLRIINTYGPTEASVITTYSEYKENEPVTIGKPLPGYEIFILDENLSPVDVNCPGELCIASMALASGYVNRPDITANKFIPNPLNPKQIIYRSGDLAKITKSGDIQFLGRIDFQVKLRGFRIELNEIENIMNGDPLIKQAIVSLQTVDEQSVLVAYYILEKNAKLDIVQLKKFLMSKLPYFMVPTLYERVESFVCLANGKVDRSKLPKPTQRLSIEYIAPKTDLEKKIALVWEEAFNLSQISIKADFFYDLGGHSLFAAQIVSKLRKISGLEQISIKDIYESKNIECLAKKFSKVNKIKKERLVINIAASWKHKLCAIGQFFGCLMGIALHSWSTFIVVLSYIYCVNSGISAVSSILPCILILFFIPLVSMIVVVCLKWILLGKVKPGKHPLWGWFYFRWWLVDRLYSNLLTPSLFAGTPIVNFYYRLLGAKIGKNCYIHSLPFVCHDLISIGYSSSISCKAFLCTYVIEDGWLILDRISIGNNCYVGDKSVVSLGSIIKSGGVLDDMSLLPRQQVIDKHEFYSGSPAKPRIAPKNHVTQQKFHKYSSNPIRGVLFGFIHYVSLIFFELIYIISYLPGYLLLDYLIDKNHYVIAFFIGLPVSALVVIMLYFTNFMLVKNYIVKKIKPGIYSLMSMSYVRCWIMEKFIETYEFLNMGDSLYLPIFLRLLGAKIGDKVECGNIIIRIPDLIKIDDGGFIATGVVMPCFNVYQGFFRCLDTHVGKEAFVGNDSLLTPGSFLGDKSLLGCLSIIPENNRSFQTNASWLGLPAILLPNRERLIKEFNDSADSKKNYFIRLVIEFIRLMFPSILLLSYVVIVYQFIVFFFAVTSLVNVFLLTPIICAISLSVLLGAFILLKWLLLGRLTPVIKPLWSLYIRKLDFINFGFSSSMINWIVQLFLGTPFMAMILRLLGSRVGKQTCIYTADFTEFDLIQIGDNVAINTEAFLATHLYEDRIFKSSYIYIDNNCSVGPVSGVLYDTVMESYSKLGSLSLLMKGEILPSNTMWEGCPAEHIYTYRTITINNSPYATSSFLYLEEKN